MNVHPDDPDWSVHLLQLAARGRLGYASRTLLLDLPALSQPWTCATGLCTPGRRAKEARSCCADLEVTPTDAERAAIDAALPEIAAFLAPRDPRWAAPVNPFDGDALRRADRRCIFAMPGPDGLSCGLHTLEDATGRPRGALKPLDTEPVSADEFMSIAKAILTDEQFEDLHKFGSVDFAYDYDDTTRFRVNLSH